MNIVEALGALCLGVVIGWLVRELVPKFKVVNVKTLTAVMSVIIGGAIIRFLAHTDSTFVWWFYPIGLLVGFISRKYEFLKKRRS